MVNVLSVIEESPPTYFVSQMINWIVFNILKLLLVLNWVEKFMLLVTPLHITEEWETYALNAWKLHSWSHYLLRDHIPH